LHSCIIFDWDDSLLASSELERLRADPSTGIGVLSAEERLKLELLDAAALEALLQAEALGRLAIITNGNAGWFSSSAAAFLPSTWVYLSAAIDAGRITFVSARDTYEAVTADPREWKARAFAAWSK
jgi:hypothetical protein